jgi:hypothetical protein
MVVNDIKNHGQSMAMSGVHESAKVIGPSVASSGREETDSVVSPISISGKIGHRHDLDCLNT